MTKDIIASLYGSNSPDQAPGDFAPARPRSSVPSTDSTTGTARSRARIQAARVLYGSPIAEAITRRSADVFERTGLVPAGLRALVGQEYPGIQETGLPDGFMLSLLNTHVDYVLNEARAETEADDAQIDQWHREVHADLSVRYGGAEAASDLLARTQRFIDATPSLSRMLQVQPDLGSRPDIVAGLVHHVFVNGIR